MDWPSVRVSLLLALATTLTLLPLGIPLALGLVYSKSRWRPLMEACLLLPFVLPPTVLGFYLLVGLAPTGLVFSFTALWIGSVILNLPIAVQSFAEAFRNVNRQHLEIASSFGANSWQIFFDHLVPLAWPGLVNGLLLSFAHTLGEFGVAMMVGGNLMGETRTMSISVYDSVQSLNMAQAHRVAGLQIALGFGLLMLLSYVKGRFPRYS